MEMHFRIWFADKIDRSVSLSAGAAPPLLLTVQITGLVHGKQGRHPTI